MISLKKASAASNLAAFRAVSTFVEGLGVLETSSSSEVKGSSESEALDPELEEVSETLELLLGCLSLSSSSIVDEILGLFLLLAFGGNFLRVGAIWQWFRTDLMIWKTSLLVK